MNHQFPGMAIKPDSKLQSKAWGIRNKVNRLQISTTHVIVNHQIPGMAFNNLLLSKVSKYSNQILKSNQGLNRNQS